ncbi:MAG: flavin reductase family protein [Anaerolineae bacterium]
MTDQREFRRTMGMFATGVTVVASGTADDFQAMTANAVTSLSLDPMLVLFCPRKTASIMPALQANETFTNKILTTHQRALSIYFANAWPDDRDPPTFEMEDWQGGPRLKYAIASVGCHLKELVDGGDHWIAIGEVLALHRSKQPMLNPLIYYRGRYREVAPSPEHDVPVEWDFSW